MLGCRITKTDTTARGGDFYMASDGLIRKVSPEVTAYGVDVIEPKSGWEFRWDEHLRQWRPFKSRAARHAFGGQSINA